ncbi:MAG: methylenetetrahydrofolate reductase [Candidatus Nasuia deltocephalinicola]
MKNKLNFSLEFFLNKNIILKILKIKNFFLLKPSFITITYNTYNINKKIINYLIKKKIFVFYHFICKKNFFNFLYFLNLYYINNLKNFLIIKGDQKKIDSYYSYNFLNLLKKNYKNKLNIALGCYFEQHRNSILNSIELKNNVLKNLIIKNIFLISQYTYNIDSYLYFFDNLNKIKYNLKILPSIMPIKNLKKIISFTNICRSELPLWILKLLNLKILKKFFFLKLNFEILINLVLKFLMFNKNKMHFYVMWDINFINQIFQKIKILINL